MEHIAVTLTPADRMILASYKIMVEWLSVYLGSAYEIVLHSLENLDRSVIKILNGYHTGRREGAPITDLALEMLSRIKETGGETPYVSYFTKNKRDEPLKSTTIAIHGEGGRVIGLLCMNFYLNTPLTDVIAAFTPRQPQPAESVPEIFSDNIGDVIDATVQQVKEQVYADEAIAPSLKNRAIVSELYEKGIFSLKDSVVRIAQLLGISRNTVYLHLRNLSTQRQEQLPDKARPTA